MTNVKEYIPIEDAKLVTEKAVSPKLSIKELTTIEKPGRPVQALQFENKKVTRKRKKLTTSKVEIEQPKSDAIVIITEKPQAAQKIAYALAESTPEKHQEKQASYYEFERENKKIIVASAVGHLFNLTYVKGQRGWPVFKIEWVPSFTTSKTAFTRVYYDLLKKISKRASEIIIATDYDIEGEVIGWNVLRFLFNKTTAKRMKYSTLTKTELINSYNSLLSELDWGHAYAGETRHFLDWLYGINLSRALMSAIKTSGSFKVLSIGRVQGPALKIIVEREKEISNFKPEPFWQVIATSNNHEFKHPKDIFNKEELENFKNIKRAEAETKEFEENIKPPVPFDLTTLQREVYRWVGVSPSQTLQIAQKLYLEGLISYPRTSSQKIPDAIQPKNIIKSLEKNYRQLTKYAIREKPVEGEKTDPAHPSIFPTGEFKKLDGNDKKIYELILKRFISSFAHDVKTSNKKVKLTAKEKDKEGNPIKFTALGMKVLDKGWTNVYPAKFEENDIPTLNGQVKIDKIDFFEKETQPPRRFTPASLITLLEKKNLGTKATRSIIVETLFERGYLDGKSIKATPLGIKLIETLEKNSPIIIDENLTRLMEEEMELMQKMNEKGLIQKEKEIIHKAENIIIDISKEFKTKEIQIGKDLLLGIEDQRKEQQENNTLMQCPSCKKGNLRILYSKKTQRYFVACSAYPECKQTYSLPPNALVKKSEKDCIDCKWPKLLSIKKGKRPWEFCFNPNCPTNIKRREEWEKKQKMNERKEEANF